MKTMPRAASAMTPFPFSLDAAETLDVADEKMRAHEVRHLPITCEGRIVGVLSAADVRAGRVRCPDGQCAVLDCCDQEPYVLDIGTPLDEVVRGMRDHHANAALITKQGRLAGIVTTQDLCRLLLEHLERIYPHPDDDSVA